MRLHQYSILSLSVFDFFQMYLIVPINRYHDDRFAREASVW